MLRSLLALIFGAAAYGYAVGTAHSQIYAFRNVVKFPLLLLGTSLICALAYYIVGRFVSPDLTFRRVQRLAINLFRDLAVLLLSLSPPVLFIALILRHTDDSQIGEYSMFLAINTFFVAVCGTVALIRQGVDMLRRVKVARRVAPWLVVAWLGLTLIVGGQLAFYLRPFFGLPASRGNVPPFALGAEPDVRGATNFYEAVLQVVTEPPLPRSWRRGL